MPWRFFCLASARLLHSLCSSAARPLQQCCVAYAVVLQRPCSRTARAEQHSCSSTATTLAVVLHCHTDMFSDHFEGNNDASRRSTDAGWGFAGIFPSVGLPPREGLRLSRFRGIGPKQIRVKKLRTSEEGGGMRRINPNRSLDRPTGIELSFFGFPSSFVLLHGSRMKPLGTLMTDFGLQKSATDRTEVR